MQAIGIVRVSTAEQAHEERYSIPHQKSHIAEECHKRTLDLRHIFEFIHSGATVLSSSGKERQQIFNYIKNSDIKIVIVHELDRLARSMLDTLLFVDELNKMNVAFISIHDGFDTSTPQGQLQMHILAAFAEYFRKQLASKVMGGMAERARSGKPMGKVPFGYSMGEAGFTIVPEEAKIVELIYKWYREENIGMRGIASRLNSMEIGTKRNNHWSHVSIRCILENEVYAGTFVWDDVRMENSHPAIIDKEAFQKAQERRKRKRSLGGQAQNENYLLSGLLRCAKCGAKINGHTQRKGKYMYRYYLCQNYSSKGTSVCSGGTIKSKLLEKAIMDDIKNLCQNSNGTLQRELIPTDADTLDNEIRLKEREVDRNKTMLQRAAEAYEVGEYDIDFFRDRKASLLKQRKQIDYEVNLLKKQVQNNFSTLELTRRMAVKIKEFGDLFMETDLKKAKARLQEAIDHIDVQSVDDMVIHYKV